MTAFDDMRDVLFEDDNQAETVVWAGVEGVRIQRREKDDVEPFDDSRRVARVRLFDVRQSQVATPVKDQVAVAHDGSFKVLAKPMLDEGVWTCEVAPA